LKADQRTGRVPVVFVSAAEGVALRNEALKLGADACIKKPIGPRDLVERVRAVLAGVENRAPCA